MTTRQHEAIIVGLLGLLILWILAVFHGVGLIVFKIYVGACGFALVMGAVERFFTKW